MIILDEQKFKPNKQIINIKQTKYNTSLTFNCIG